MENQRSTRIKQQLNSDRFIPDGLFPSAFYAGLKHLTVNNGGHTERFDRDPVTFGFVIGNGRDGIQLTRKNFFSGVALESFLDPYLKRWKENGFDGFGTWIDPETGTVYIDPVEVVKTEEHAKLIGYANGEKYIYDAGNKKTVNV